MATGYLRLSSKFDHLLSSLASKPGYQGGYVDSLDLTLLIYDV